MPYVQCRAFKFLGGPLDGHIEILTPPIDSLLVVKTVALTPQLHWLIRLLRVVCMHPKRNSASIAIYQLRPQGEEMVYLYLHSDVTCDLSHEAGSVRVVDDTIAFERIARPHEKQSPYPLLK